MELSQYIPALLDAESETLNELYRQTQLHVLYPDMISGHEQGRLLSMLSHMVQPERILEIGTFTGYSAICLAEGLAPSGCLHTIEINDELREIASEFFAKADMTDRIVQHIGDALEIIPNLDLCFDMVFIDAAKKQYQAYYDLVFDKVAEGGYILIDNVLWYNKVFNEKKSDKTTEYLKKFNAFVGRDSRVEKAFIGNRDGMLILRKK